MPRPLVIVESPAKAKTIAGYLGKDYAVMASVGHVRDLPESADQVPEQFKGTPAGRLGVAVDDHFTPIYVVSSGKKKVIAELKRALKDADELYLATDEDREGEAIAWHILEVLKPKVPVKRMVFHEITRSAIADAVDNWRELDMKLVEAQEGRRILDRLVGYEVSPVLWKKVRPRLSAGRVQSVAVRLVVERERERMRFRAAQWHDLRGTFERLGEEFTADLVAVDGTKVADGRDFDPTTGKLAQRSASAQETGAPPGSDPDQKLGRAALVLDEAAAAALTDRLTGADFAVDRVESKQVTERPPPPFTTSTLQQEASRKLGFGSARTMAVAQRLYERGYITYMRTDSIALSSQAVDAARTAITERFGGQFLHDGSPRWKNKVKNAQEAHEAVRPAGERIRPPEEVASELDADERRVYELVWIRTVASQMADARARQVVVRLSGRSSAGERAEFRAAGKTYEFLGFRRAYVESVDETADADGDDAERVLPAVAQGDALGCRALEVVAHETKPRARFTEASLVKELEEDGIGRPSTYASIIQTILSRDYVFKKGNALVPTWTAFAVVQLLEQHFAHLVDYRFTALMEEDLDVIARHEAEAEKWLHEFYFGNGQAGLRELVDEERVATIDARAICTIPLGVDAEGRTIAVRVGRYGPYLERGDGEARAALPDDLPPDELTIEEAVARLEMGRDDGRVLGTDPETGLDVVARSGRFGPYVQLGPAGEGEKPKTASLFASMSLDSVTLDDALRLLSLPRVVGVDDEGVEITAQNGRYGPYLKRGTDTRSLDAEDALFSITREQALEILAQPKRGRARASKPPLAELGPHPDSGAPVRILDGRWGPYATDGSTHASLPRGRGPEDVTLDEAVALLRERAARGPARKRATKRATKKAAKKPAKKAATKAATKKPAKKAATKAATKKATAKKAAKSTAEKPVADPAAGAAEEKPEGAPPVG